MWLEVALERRVDGAPSARDLAHDGGELGLGRVVQRGEVPRGFNELVRRTLLAREVRLLGGAERHVFLVRAEEADGLAVLRIPRHAIPYGRLERRRAAQDERVEALAH